MTAAVRPRPGPVPDLDAFAAAGLLREVRGHPCVAGTSTDPGSGAVDCLVEYAPAELLTDPTALAAVVRQVAADEPCGQWRDLVVRVEGTVTPAPPLDRDITYLELDPPDAPAPQLPPGMRITDGTGTADDHVRRWLREAMDTGNRQRRASIGEAAMDSLVDACLTAPGRVSFVVRADTPEGEVPVAHATLLTEARDELFDRRFVDLVDILVAGGHDTRLLTAALVAKASAHAASAGLPLVGNVIHGRTPESSPAGAKVVRSLTRQGWRITHTYWRCGLPLGVREER